MCNQIQRVFGISWRSNLEILPPSLVQLKTVEGKKKIVWNILVNIDLVCMLFCSMIFAVIFQELS